MGYIEINNGSFDNDPTADKIRIAFEDTKTMFQELYNYVNGNIRLIERVLPLSEEEDTLILNAVHSINNYAGSLTAPAGSILIISFLVENTGFVPSSPFESLSNLGLRRISYAIKTPSGADGVTYGAGNTQVNPTQLVKWIDETVLFDDSNVIDLGDIGSTDIWDFVNGTGPYEVLGFTIFLAVIDSVQKIYAFTGVSGTYGDGETQTVEEDWVDISAQGEVPFENQIPLTVFSQHTESDTTGDTGTNLLQPDFGAAIFTPADMQEGSVYEGSLLLEIDNNSGSGTENPVTLFGIELFEIKTAIPEIKGKLNFKITFYNQSFNNVDYKISFDFISSGLMYFGTKTDTIDNTVSADIEFTVGGDVADIIKVNAPILQRC